MDSYIYLSDVIRNESQTQRVLDLLEKIRQENEVEDYQREEQAKSELLDELEKK